MATAQLGKKKQCIRAIQLRRVSDAQGIGNSLLREPLPLLFSYFFWRVTQGQTYSYFKSIPLGSVPTHLQQLGLGTEDWS